MLINHLQKAPTCPILGKDGAFCYQKEISQTLNDIKKCRQKALLSHIMNKPEAHDLQKEPVKGFVKQNTENAREII